MVKFRDLQIGDTFDCVSPDRMMNSFYDRCEKISTRKYRSLVTGYDFEVGSVNVTVYHVNEN